MPREVTSASFDGTVLGVADRAMLNAFAVDLSPMGSWLLQEACASSVMVSGTRFVCGPKNDWDRVFYTYELTTGRLVASSHKYTYNGIPMTRVSGTDDFVTVTVGSSPSDFHLYRTLPSGEVTFLNESPYHGDFGVNNVFGFDGTPPVHLATFEGLLLRINAATCGPQSNSTVNGCFLKDGSLGTLTGAQRFVAMTDDGAGSVFGLVDPARDSFSDNACQSKCLLQKIDVPTRKVQAQKTYAFQPGAIRVMRYDPPSKRIIFGYAPPSPRFDQPAPGYTLDLLGYD
jgi:hypothetical protein